MTKIKATVLKKNNKNEFVILPYEDFLKIQEAHQSSRNEEAMGSIYKVLKKEENIRQQCFSRFLQILLSLSIFYG